MEQSVYQVYDLTGKHIMVTGASSGIGKATALRLSALGARVTLVARNEERLRETLSQLATPGAYYVYDLSDVDGMEAFIKKAVAEQGKFDGLMYSAGDCLRAPIPVCKPHAVRESMQVNYFAFVEMLRCFARSRVTNNGASLVTMSSASSMNGEKGLLTLCASKAAMNSAVRCGALELAPRGIRVNAIAAAYVFGSRMVDTTIDIFGTDQVEKNIAENQPLGVGKPEDIADAAAFLLSEASRYMTGVIMPVDGGYLA